MDLRRCLKRADLNYITSTANFLPYLAHPNLSIKTRAKLYGQINESLNRPLFNVLNSHSK